jgi:hypothetical protein
MTIWGEIPAPHTSCDLNKEIEKMTSKHSKNNQVRRNRAAVFVAVALILAVALTGCGLIGQQAVYDTATVEVFVTSNLLESLVFVGIKSISPGEIDSVVLTVVGEDKYGVHQDPLVTVELAGSGAAWSVTVPELPLGPVLTFTLEAFDGDNRLIYTGTTTTALSSANLTVAIVLTPYVEGSTVIFFPVIRQIVRPAEIIEGTDAQVSVALEGSSEEILSAVATSGGGIFTPSGDELNPIEIPLSGGAATLELTYGAPADDPATYVHSLWVANEQGNSVQREFSTVVVWATGTGEIAIGGIAPAITGISLSLNGSDLIITAAVSDDGPLSELSYEWSFDGGLALTDSAVNPTVLEGYSEAATGVVTLRVTDSDASIQVGGLSTEVSFLLPADLFPDDVVGEPEEGPPVGELFKITASDGANYDRFGTAVSVSGDMVIVGSYSNNSMGADSGSAYIFRWNGTTWEKVVKLTASDGSSYDYFGISVSISSDAAIVGSHGDDDSGAYSGSAYIFRWNGTTWEEEDKLIASDGWDSDQFGYSVSISSDTAIVGSHRNDDIGVDSGSAYVFRWNGTTWEEEAKLTASDGSDNDYFGRSVSISGDTVIIGSHGDDNIGGNSGSAYVFHWNGTTWEEENKLIASDGSDSYLFGSSVSISGDTAIVGSYGDDGMGVDSGSAYVFRWNGTTWDEEDKLIAFDGSENDFFGISVSISGDTAIVGSKYDDDIGINSGSSYIFRWNGTTWEEVAKLIPSDGSDNDNFGVSVSISGDTAITGSYRDDGIGVDSGSAYIIQME